MSLDHIKVKKHQFSSSEMIYNQESVELWQKMKVFFFNNFENNFYEICTTLGLD